MSELDPRGSAEFKPAKLGPRHRRMDPVALGLVVVVVALALAVLKPWAGVDPGIAAVPAPASAAPGSSAEPSAISTRGALVPPTWEDVRSVISYHDAWGIRAIVLGSANGETAASPGISERYAEHWAPAERDGGEDATAILDGGTGPIVALGVTFPPSETPLDVRIWLDHAGGELEWMDARPVSDMPARGAYLYERPSVAGAAVRSWAPGRYRMDVLVGGGIRRIDLEMMGPSGKLPAPEPWPSVDPPFPDFDMSKLEGLPVGLFAQVDGAVKPLASAAGPPLGETGAWLDLSRPASDLEPRMFVARTYQPRATQLGVVLPPFSTVRSVDLRRLAPFDDTGGLVGETVSGPLESVSFAAFGPPWDGVWHPGVYALSVAWTDVDGRHDQSWHVELRPGPLRAEPILLSATRAWARYAGFSGVLLGTTGSLDGASQAAGIRLLEIAPQTGAVYPGLTGLDQIGCGETVVQGRPDLIGIVGPVDGDLTPVVARILSPMADGGSLLTLTAAGAVPGLTLVTPLVTSEFGGPASYGFRAGSGVAAPGYTICIGSGAPAG